MGDESIIQLDGGSKDNTATPQGNPDSPEGSTDSGKREVVPFLAKNESKTGEERNPNLFVVTHKPKPDRLLFAIKLLVLAIFIFGIVTAVCTLVLAFIASSFSGTSGRDIIVITVSIILLVEGICIIFIIGIIVHIVSEIIDIPRKITIELDTLKHDFVHITRAPLIPFFNSKNIDQIKVTLAKMMYYIHEKEYYQDLPESEINSLKKLIIPHLELTEELKYIITKHYRPSFYMFITRGGLCRMDDITKDNYMDMLNNNFQNTTLTPALQEIATQVELEQTMVRSDNDVFYDDKRNLILRTSNWQIDDQNLKIRQPTANPAIEIDMIDFDHVETNFSHKERKRFTRSMTTSAINVLKRSASIYKDVTYDTDLDDTKSKFEVKIFLKNGEMLSIVDELVNNATIRDMDIFFNKHIKMRLKCERMFGLQELVVMLNEKSPNTDWQNILYSSEDKEELQETIPEKSDDTTVVEVVEVVEEEQNTINIPEAKVVDVGEDGQEDQVDETASDLIKELEA